MFFSMYQLQSLSQQPPPLLSAQRNKPPTLKRNSNHSHRRHFHCCSCGNQTSSQRHPNSEPSSSRQTLSLSQLALWLRSCRTLRDVKRVHAVVIRRLREQDTYVFNNLISVYIRFEDLSRAHNVFDEMSLRNVVTWTAMINGYLSFGFDDEALGLFKDSVDTGVQPNAKMFVCLLNLCSKRKDPELGRQLHAGMVKGWWSKSNVIVESAIVKLYAQCEDIRSAFCGFDRMANKDVVCWTTMVTACAQQGRGSEALRLFARMLSEGLSPNEFSLCSALKACGDHKALSLGCALHGAVVKRLYDPDVFLGTSLLDMYAKCARLADARSVFDRMRRRNTATWTAMIAGYARHEGLAKEAVWLFRAMKRRKVAANGLTVVGVVRGSMETSLHLDNTLVWFYCRCGDYRAASRVLERMPVRDVVSWTALISGCTSASPSLSLGSEALGLLRVMVAEGVELTAFTYSSALKACAGLAAAAPGRLIHSAACKTAAASRSVFVGSALIQMYAKCGRVSDATRVFEEIGERNLVAWKSMVMGYTRNGRCREALRLVYRMRAEGLEVDNFILTEVLNACGGVHDLGVELPANRQFRSG